MIAPKRPRIFSLLILFFLMLPLYNCRRSTEELPLQPPITHPLTREYIGYGVVNVSFAHLLIEPGAGGSSRGYLRRGTVVRILERRPLKIGAVSELWVLVEGNYGSLAETLSPGWLQENTVEVFDNESRAITASKMMTQ